MISKDPAQEISWLAYKIMIPNECSDVAPVKLRQHRAIAAIFAPCSGAKALAPAKKLQALDLPRAPQAEVEREWLRRVKHATPTIAAGDYYVGRGYRRLHKLSSGSRIRFYVISAGLGLIPASRRIPPYDLTTTAGPASIVDRVKGDFKAEAWWATLQDSKFSARLNNVCTSGSKGRFIFAVSNQYARLIGESIGQLPVHVLERCRLFGSGIEPLLPKSIRGYVMPYDGRLDRLVSGPMAEFPHRAVIHFASICANDVDMSVEADRRAVADALARAKLSARPKRKKASDKEILSLISAIGPKPKGVARKLRAVRDRYHVACEADRFSRLLKEAAC